MTSMSTSVPPVSARSRYAANLYFQDGVVLTAVLAGLLYLLLAISLDAAGYVESLAVLVPVTLGALTLGFLMAYSRFDAFFALSHSMFTGLALILFLMTGLVSQPEISPFVSNGVPEAQAKAYFVLLRWLNWVDSAISDKASADNYVFVFEMCFLVWWLTYLGIWSVFRYGYTWRAIVPAGVVLIINAYYAPNSILGFLLVFCMLALMLFVRTNLAELQHRWREQRVYFAQDITLDFLRNGVMYGAIVLALAWLVPGLGRSMQVQTVLTPINQQWEETARWWNRMNQGLKRRAGQPGSAFGRQLALGGARVVGDQIVFTVDAPMGRYWRAAVYDTYTGRGWVNTAEEEQSFAAREAVPGVEWAMRVPLTQTVTMVAPLGNMLFAAQEIDRASVPMRAIARPAAMGGTPAGEAASGPVEIAMAWATIGLGKGDRYTVVSRYAAVTERALAAAAIPYPKDITDTFLQLPEKFSARVKADAQQITAGETTAYGKAKAIERYLRAIPYNDDIAAPPEGRDPVEYFLYDIHEGYCDYYATSMAVMLRSLGVPARVVSGYAEGEVDQDAFEFVIRERDAHTWVEVYFPTYGWIEFEPTGAESELDRPTGSDASDSEVLDALGESAALGSAGVEGGPLSAEQAMLQMLEDQEALGQQDGSLARRTWWAWGLLTPLAVLVGAWLVWRTRVMGPTAFSADLPPILYARMQRWARRIGVQAAISETPYEQARALSRATPEGRGAIREITEGYVRYRFRQRSSGSRTADEQAGTRLFGSWRELEPVLWRAWIRKLLRRRPDATRDPFMLVRE